MAVIEAATQTGAKAMGAERDMGTIEAGKLGNMVVLSANPLEDVRNMRSVVMTVKRGRTYLRADYRAPEGGK
jgi:imidazolonepropionase-like amidohydrolase